MLTISPSFSQSKPRFFVAVFLIMFIAFSCLGMLVNAEEAWADRTVYVSRTGKYHFQHNCSGMKRYTAMSHSEADAAGYVPCKKCASAYSGAVMTTQPSSAKAGWQQDSTGWWYRYSDGSYPYNQWKQLSGIWYFFNNSGYMKTGWLKDGGHWYYLNSDGSMATGWLKDGGKWYYLNPGGNMATGWKKVDGKWYYLASSGVMQTGWQKIDGKWYYFASSGVMQTGWLREGGKWYYLASSGAMITGWIKDAGKWYYLNSSGAMCTGWVKSSGEWYYLSSDGSMLTSTKTPDGYYIGSDGAMSIHSLYKTVLEQAANSTGVFSYWKESSIGENYEARYILYDFDNNGIKELLVHNPTAAEAGKECHIYSIANDKVVYCGRVDMWHATLGLLKDGTMFKTLGDPSGYRLLNTISVSGTTLSQSEYSRTPSSYTREAELKKVFGSSRGVLDKMYYASSWNNAKNDSALK